MPSCLLEKANLKYAVLSDFVRFLFFFLCSFLFSFDEQEVMDLLKPVEHELQVGELFFRYFSDVPLAQASMVERVVFVIHGYGCNGRDYFRFVQKAKLLNDSFDVVVIALQFYRSDLPRGKGSPEEGAVSWKSGGWAEGSLSSTEPRVSSFTIVDTLVDRVLTNFVNVKHVVITGHSAGGQFVHRYALLTSSMHVNRMKFVPINPSSYTYLNTERPLNEQPPFKFACGRVKGFNEYKYGLDKLNSYGRERKDCISLQYAHRDVTYVLAEKDTDDNKNLDVSTAAMEQGKNRWVRGQAYFAHLQSFFGEKIHELLILSDVGHDAELVYLEDQVRKLLFRK